MKNKRKDPLKLKVVILGEENVGKTTLVHQLNPAAKSVEHVAKNGQSITVGCDFGKIELANHQLHLFGTPGHSRFEFARQIVSAGADLGILLIDSDKMLKNGISDRERFMENELIEKNIPYLICINQMTEKMPSKDEIESAFSTPVHVISAKSGEGIDKIKDSLSLLIEQYKNKPVLNREKISG